MPTRGVGKTATPTPRPKQPRDNQKGAPRGLPKPGLIGIQGKFFDFGTPLEVSRGFKKGNSHPFGPSRFPRRNCPRVPPRATQMCSIFAIEMFRPSKRAPTPKIFQDPTIGGPKTRAPWSATGTGETLSRPGNHPRRSTWEGKTK